MKDTKGYRLPKDVTASYDSFEELRAAMKMRPVSHRTKNKEKLEKQQERFQGKCRVCGMPLQYIQGTNVMVCTNESCAGIKVNEELTLPVNRILDNKGAEIAQALFG